MARKSLKAEMAINFKKSLIVDDPTPNVKDDIEVQLSPELASAGTDMTTAPTKNPSRPRALTIGYSPTTKTVYIVFRTNHWHQYNDVSTEIWLGLKSSNSTNEYLPTLESNCSSHHEARIKDMSTATLTQFMYSSEWASSIQKGSLKNWDAESFFKEN
jgi:hypothetical protein